MRESIIIYLFFIHIIICRFALCKSTYFDTTVTDPHYSSMKCMLDIINRNRSIQVNDVTAMIINPESNLNHRQLEDSIECEMCTRVIWDVISCRLGSIKDTSKFGNFTVYGQHNNSWYENMCCASNRKECCRSRNLYNESNKNRPRILYGIIILCIVLCIVVFITCYILHSRLRRHNNNNIQAVVTTSDNNTNDEIQCNGIVTLNDSSNTCTSTNKDFREWLKNQNQSNNNQIDDLSITESINDNIILVSTTDNSVHDNKVEQHTIT